MHSFQGSTRIKACQTVIKAKAYYLQILASKLGDRCYLVLFKEYLFTGPTQLINSSEWACILVCAEEIQPQSFRQLSLLNKCINNVSSLNLILISRLKEEKQQKSQATVTRISINCGQVESTLSPAQLLKHLKRHYYTCPQIFVFFIMQKLSDLVR